MDSFFKHPQAVIDSAVSIGKGTRVWAFVHLLSGAVIGEDCNICDHCFIEGKVRIGSRVTIKCGVWLWDGLVVEDDVHIGPNATFTNDKRPRSRSYPPEFLQTLMRQGCSLGANCTILPGLKVGRYAMVAAGAVVTHDVPDYALVIGNPARLAGWVCRCGEKLTTLSGSRLVCHCGLAYEQLAENAVREIDGAAHQIQRDESK